jgi:hypothetical protein
VERISFITEADHQNVVILPERFKGLYARLDRVRSGKQNVRVLSQSQGSARDCSRRLERGECSGGLFSFRMIRCPE